MMTARGRSTRVVGIVSENSLSDYAGRPTRDMRFVNRGSERRGFSRGSTLSQLRAEDRS